MLYLILTDSYTVFDFKEKEAFDAEVMKKYGVVKGQSGTSDPNAFPHELHTVCFKDFMNSLDKGEDFRINAKEARKSVELIVGIYKSAKELRPVKLNTR